MLHAAIGLIFVQKFKYVFRSVHSWSLGCLINFGPSGVRALPLAGGINEGGHYFIYFSFLLFSPLKKNNTNSGEKNKIWTPTPWPPGGRFLVFFGKFQKEVSQSSETSQGFILTIKGDIHPQKNSETFPGPLGDVFRFFKYFI